MKYAIKHRYTNAVLYETDIPDDTPRGLQCRAALEKATQARANLAGAYLAGAYLDGAYLAGANLDGAYLAGANLAGATLDGANLAGAYIAGANLVGAYIAGKKKLIGARPVFQIGPIGCRCAQFVSYITEAGVLLNAGCFWGTVDEFRAKLADTHGDNEHAQEYKAALVMVAAHASIWTPKEDVCATK